ncbi:MAG: adenosine deaminase [Crocinitomicaceae bacterium]|jgi:adenosine deaminase|nr:adenosine deaminase [Crocinitomicaceae bacterium]
MFKSPPVPQELMSMPKVELHCHLELAIRQSTLREFAGISGLNLSTNEAFSEAFLIQEPMGELKSVLHKFLNTRNVIKQEDWMERVAFEACEDMYLLSNVRILELRYAPSFLLDHHHHMKADRLQEAILRGVQRAEQLYPIAVGLICILQRTKSVEENKKWVDFALQPENQFIGLDLADNEVDFDPEPFVPLFHKAKNQGLGITVHAGEPNVPGISRNIRTAIEQMGADRIGHGLQAVEDPDVMSLLRKRKIPLELCPTSNVLTGACNSIGTHPFKSLLDAGVQVTINTDDPGIMCTSLIKEYHLLSKAFGIDLKSFENCNAWALDASFITSTKKKSIWNKRFESKPS